jgi:hypothetical protein
MDVMTPPTTSSTLFCPQLAASDTVDVMAPQSPSLEGSELSASCVQSILCKETSNDIRPSISQLAALIMSGPGLEGKRWYVAGALLNYILKAGSTTDIHTFNDEDIAIRAVFQGWSDVQARYALDIGWQWLKEIDENLYLSTRKPERLQILRNCRFQLLNQLYPGAGYDKMLPVFFAPRPSQTYLRHDPLIEYFPWPAFRDRLLFAPRRYITNGFMDMFCKHIHVLWPYSNDELFVQDSSSGTYSYSSAFEECIHDIRTYTCDPELFEQFPELLSDIPRHSPSPYSMVSSALARRDHEAIDGSTTGRTLTWRENSMNC